MVICPRIALWGMKIGVQAGKVIQGSNDPWAKNAKLKESGHSRFATQYINKKYWQEINELTWDEFRTKYNLKLIEYDKTVSDQNICCVFPKCVSNKK